MPEITDDKSAQAWLETQPHQVQIRMGARAALRGFPEFGFVQDRRMRVHFAIAFLRAALISAAAGMCELKGINRLKSSADSSARLASDLDYPLAIDAFAYSAIHAVLAIEDPAHSVDATLYWIDDKGTHAAAAYSAITSDTDAGNLWPQLWPNGEMPTRFTQGWNQLGAFFNEDPETWSFWLEWYEGLLNGTPLPWDLIYRIALEVTEEDWDAGPERVAARIREIREAFEADEFERPDSVPEVERRQLIEHVKKLLADPEMTTLAAEGAAETLDRAIREFMDNAPANCLPDELAHLDALPPIFRSMANLVKGGEKAQTKEKKLAAQIEALNEKVARLEADLKEAREKSVNGRFKIAFINAAGAALGAGVVGSLGLGLSHFFGTWPGDLTLENLRGWLGDLQSAVPALDDASSTLPPDFEV